MKDEKNKWEDEYDKLKKSKNLWRYTFSDLNRNTESGFARLLVGAIFLLPASIIAYFFEVRQGIFFTVITLGIRAVILIPKYFANRKNRKLTKEEYTVHKIKQQNIWGPIGYALLIILLIVKLIQIFTDGN